MPKPRQLNPRVGCRGGRRRGNRSQKNEKAREKVSPLFLARLAVRAVFGECAHTRRSSTQRPIASIERSTKVRLSHPNAHRFSSFLRYLCL